MKSGLIWRVGDGFQIDIWMDPWIPKGVMRRPVTPRGNTVLNKVSDLTYPIIRAWDTSLILWEEDVKNILAIHVRCESDDTLAWHFDTKGTFFGQIGFTMSLRIREKGRLENKKQKIRPHQEVKN